MGASIPGINFLEKTSTEIVQLGTKCEDELGNEYRFVKIADAVPVTVGMVLAPSTGGKWHATPDRNGGTQLGDNVAMLPLGIAVVAVSADDITAGNLYCWILRKGYTSVKGDDSVAVGDFVVLDTAADGVADTMADGEEEQVFGLAYTADDNTTHLFDCYVYNCL